LVFNLDSPTICFNVIELVGKSSILVHFIAVTGTLRNVRCRESTLFISWMIVDVEIVVMCAPTMAVIARSHSFRLGVILELNNWVCD
jgi:hypothetical protein